MKQRLRQLCRIRLVNELLRGFLPLLLGWKPEWLARIPVVGPVTVEPYPGRPLHFDSDGNDSVVNHVAWLGLDHYEPGTIRVFCELAQRSGLVVDVGANTGLFALLAARAKRDLQVVAIEAVPELAERIRTSAAHNELSQIEIYEVAVGRDEGQTTFFYPHDACLSLPTSGALTDLHPGLSRAIDVPLTTLDRLSAAWSKPLDLIKIDVEGHEADVLAGATDLLRRDDPIVLLEVLPMSPVDQLLEAMAGWDFKMFQIQSSGLVPRDTLQGDPEGRWLNWLLVPPSKMNWVENLLASTAS